MGKGKHLTFSPSGTRMVPRPRDGIYFSPQGDTGVAATWARQEAFAQFNAWAGNDQEKRWYVNRIITNISAQPGDQVIDIFVVTGITPTSEAASAVNLATQPVRFAVSGVMLPAMDSTNKIVVPGWAWDGSKCKIADDSLLTNGYYHQLNYDLGKGGYVG